MLTMAVLVDPLGGERPEARSEARQLRDALADRGQVWQSPDAESLDAAVAQIASGGFDLLGVTGGDAGLSAVLSALHHLGPLPSGLRFVPLGGGSQSLVKASVGLKNTPIDTLRRIVALSRKGPGFRRPPLKDARRRSLRVVVSSRPRADLGFTFGTGALYAILERSGRRGTPRTGLRAALGAARGLFESEGAWRPIEARVTIDGAPFANSLRFAGASTLPDLPLGLRPFSTPIETDRRLHFMWHDMGFTATAALALPLSRGRLQNTHSRTLSAQRVHLDLASGYVLDGALYPAGAPQVLSIEPGPIVDLVGF